MMRSTYFNKSLNKMVTKEYDYQNYVKPLHCTCCDTTVYHISFDKHNKSEFHKTAQHLRDNSIKPIENIKKAVIEYKMVKKYMEKTFNNDSSSNSEEQPQNNEDEIKITDEKIIRRIQRKSETYKRQLDRRAAKYEKTQGIEKLVNTIKTTTNRLTKLQIIKFNDYLIKYPYNELLLSIQHLVPSHDVMVVLDNVPKTENK